MVHAPLSRLCLLGLVLGAAPAGASEYRVLVPGPFEHGGTLSCTDPGEARFALVTAALAGFGRALAEVGAVLIVGGNINHLTRVMTTTIALETARGNLALALGLGVILIGLSVAITAALLGVRRLAEARGYG